MYIRYGFCTLAVMMFLFLVTACEPAPLMVKETRNMMDTRVTVSLYAQDQGAAQKALDAAFSEMEGIEDVYSAYDNRSLVAYLNQEKVLRNPPREVVRIFRKARYYSSITNGSFDITVQPMLHLYTHSFETLHRPPTASEVNTTLKLVGYDAIIVNDSMIRLEEGMKVTLGGIVKGYAIDQARDALLRHNISSALIDAGGDMRSIGTKPDGEAWRVAVRDPDDRDNYLMDFTIMDKAVATSGNYERYFNENKSFHHIVDPRTGYSAEGVISATVIAPTATQADALSTAVFVMGPEKGRDLVGRLERVEAMIVTDDREIVYSEGFPRT